MEITVAGVALDVAVADSVDERRTGLMGVTDLGDLDGMIFLHDVAGRVSYSMQNTLIPLDIWFIDASGVIVGTAEMEPCETTLCPSYVSPEPVDRVLETPLGVYEFEVGDRVELGSS